MLTPSGGDDLIELGPQQILVGAQQVQELLVRAARGVHAVLMLDLGHVSPSGYALIAWRSGPLLAMAILRGLAASATGICNVSTPLS